MKMHVKKGDNVKILCGKVKDISGVMWISVALFAAYIVLKVMGLA